MRVRVILGFLLVAGGAGPALAQQKPSIRELLSQGYEVKAVNNIELDFMKPMGYEDGTAPQLLVTLQNGSALAVCQFSVANWSLVNPEAMDGRTQCDTMDARATNSATGSGTQTLEPAEHLRH